MECQKCVVLSFKCRKCGAEEIVITNDLFDYSYPAAWGHSLCTKCYNDIFGWLGLNGRERVKGKPNQPRLVEIRERRER